MITRKIPWLTWGAIETLENFFRAKPGARVLETGGGASTLWMRKRTEHLITIEHDITIIEELHKKDSRLALIYKPLPYFDILYHFRENFFDLILIDGRNRVDCGFVSTHLLKPGGILMLDNSERPRYKPLIDALKSWPVTSCIQDIPDKEGFYSPGWTTTWWRKP